MLYVESDEHSAPGDIGRLITGNVRIKMKRQMRQKDKKDDWKEDYRLGR